MKMSKYLKIVIPVVVLLSMLLSSCAQAPAQVQEVIKTITVIETKIVEVAGTPEVKTEIKVVTATPEPKQQKLEIFHWWTAPGEREAADAISQLLQQLSPTSRLLRIRYRVGVAQNIVSFSRPALQLASLQTPSKPWVVLS